MQNSILLSHEEALQKTAGEPVDLYLNETQAIDN